MNNLLLHVILKLSPIYVLHNGHNFLFARYFFKQSTQKLWLHGVVDGYIMTSMQMGHYKSYLIDSFESSLVSSSGKLCDLCLFNFNGYN